MDAGTAEAAFMKRGKRESTSRRMVGYAALLQEVGWDRLAQLIPVEAIDALRRTFEEAEVDPFCLDFPDGAIPYLEEVAHSSAHTGSSTAARKILDSTPPH